VTRQEIQAEIDKLQPLTRQGDPIDRRIAFAMICALDMATKRRRPAGVPDMVESARVNAHLCRQELGVRQ
jgi:hypothetical protein